MASVNQLEMNTSAVVGSSAQAERQAVNTICQGSAADLVKLAMIQLHKQLQQQLPAESCRLLLQVQCMTACFEASQTPAQNSASKSLMSASFEP